MTAGNTNTTHSAGLGNGSPGLQRAQSFMLSSKNLKKRGHPLSAVHANTTPGFTPSKSVSVYWKDPMIKRNIPSESVCVH